MSRKMRRGAIYFIQEDEGAERYIKIGYSLDLDKRLYGIQTGNPRKLKVLGYIYPDPKEFPIIERAEAAIHEQFASACIRGEWFCPTTELLAYIEEVKHVVEVEMSGIYQDLLFVAKEKSGNYEASSERYAATNRLKESYPLSFDAVAREDWAYIRGQILQLKKIHVYKKSWPNMVARILWQSLQEVPIKLLESDAKLLLDYRVSKSYKILVGRILHNVVVG